MGEVYYSSFERCVTVVSESVEGHPWGVDQRRFKLINEENSCVFEFLIKFKLLRNVKIKDVGKHCEM